MAFPGAGMSVNPRSGVVRRHHVYEERLQRAIKRAAPLAGIVNLVGAQKAKGPNRYQFGLCCASCGWAYRLLGGTSVQDACATSAAMPMGSNSVGWGWMVLPMSRASATISITRYTVVADVEAVAPLIHSVTTCEEF